MLQKAFLILALFQCSALAFSNNGNPDFSEVTVISQYTRFGSIPVAELLANLDGIVDKTVVPENIYHGAVIAFGKVYDYIKGKGILVTDEIEFFRNNVMTGSDHNPLWTNSVFNTTRTEKEFSKWVEIQRLNNFTPTNYDVAENNCLTFVALACKFLGGDEGTVLRNQRQFALNNKEWVRFSKAFSAA